VCTELWEDKALGATAITESSFHVLFFFYIQAKALFAIPDVDAVASSVEISTHNLCILTLSKLFWHVLARNAFQQKNFESP